MADNLELHPPTSKVLKRPADPKCHETRPPSGGDTSGSTKVLMHTYKPIQVATNPSSRFHDLFASSVKAPSNHKLAVMRSHPH